MPLVKYEDLANAMKNQIVLNGWTEEDIEKFVAKVPTILASVYEMSTVISEDPSTNVGAMLVSNRSMPVAFGGNTLTFGTDCEEHPEYVTRPLKYTYMEHAERNAIFHAACNGISTSQTVMVCPYFACTECSRAIVQSGIKVVVGHKKIIDNAPQMWRESIDIGRKIFDAAGVIYCEYDGTVNSKIPIMFNGKKWMNEFLPPEVGINTTANEIDSSTVC